MNLRLIFLSCAFALLFSKELLAITYCKSTLGRDIELFQYFPRDNGLKRRILVIGGIHGDEPPSKELALLWKNRLDKIKSPSNYWAILPELNPDGFNLKTRSNANGVDLNRNFPTKDWGDFALRDWKMKLKSNPRRFPGKSAGSEAEVLCLVKFIEEFRPELVVSIHIPYGQFDFDGPSKTKLRSQLLPWKRLGTFPGSLGRYLWDERKIPTLTIELRENSLEKFKSQFMSLQDEISDLL